MIKKDCHSEHRLKSTNGVQKCSEESLLAKNRFFLRQNDKHNILTFNHPSKILTNFHHVLLIFN
ncbi:hypothetical protein ACFP3I_21160 [Chryseobacterium arachidis]|uniref:hypothetical protein n=1 Tax=Chryseobacterium arachidis TaxID=1416778 RepID=UPI0036211BE0